jgi:hypothetical protein
MVWILVRARFAPSQVFDVAIGVDIIRALAMAVVTNPALVTVFTAAPFHQRGLTHPGIVIVLDDANRSIQRSRRSLNSADNFLQLLAGILLSERGGVFGAVRLFHRERELETIGLSRRGADGRKLEEPRGLHERFDLPRLGRIERGGIECDRRTHQPGEAAGTSEG